MDQIKSVLVKPLTAAAMLSVSRSKIYELINLGEIPSVRISGLIRVPLEAIEKIAADAMKAAPERAR